VLVVQPQQRYSVAEMHITGRADSTVTSPWRKEADARACNQWKRS